MSYEFLDAYNWDEEFLPYLCDHFQPDKIIILMNQINYDISPAICELHLQAGIIDMKIPIFKSKFNSNHYCIFPGEKRSNNGNKYYNITFSDNNLSYSENISSIKRIKKSLLNIFLYDNGNLEIDEVFDNPHDIILPNFIISASLFYARKQDKKPS